MSVALIAQVAELDARGLMVELERIKSMTPCSKSLQILILGARGQVRQERPDERDSPAKSSRVVGRTKD